MKKKVTTVLLVFFAITGFSNAQPVVDGVLDDVYEVDPNVQFDSTGFGDNSDPDVLKANGSELDAVYALMDENNLFLFFSGNLQTNFNKFELFLDYKSGGQNRLRGDNPNVDFDGLNRMGDDGSGNGLTFETGFDADFYLTLGGGNDPVEFFASAAEILTGGGGTGEFIGGSGGGGNNTIVSSSANFPGIEIAIDNSNTLGVTDTSVVFVRTDPESPFNVSTGIEIKIPLSLLGDPQFVKLVGFINGSGHDFVSNQVLPSVFVTPNELGEPRDVDFSIISGTQSLTAGKLMLSGQEGFRMWSIPSDDQFSWTVRDFLDPIWTQGATGADSENTNDDANTFQWANGFWGDLNDLTIGTFLTDGRLTFVFSDDNFDGSPDGFPKTLSISATTFIGTSAPATINQFPDNFSFIGNPFTKTIDFDDLSTQDLTDIAYVWNPNAGSDGAWESWNGSQGDLTNGLIAPFQAFFVQNVSSPTSPSLTFPQSATTTGGTFRGKTVTEDSFALRLEAEGDTFINSTWLSFSEEGNVFEKGNRDALELEPLSDEYVQLATQKPGQNTLIDINMLPEKFNESVEIPVELKSTYSGEFTIRSTDFSVPESVELTFVDHVTGERLPLTETFTYTFTMDATSTKKKVSGPALLKTISSLTQTASTQNNRFGIVIEPGVATSVDEPDALPQQVELAQNFPNPFNPTTNIQFALPSSERVSLEVYDVLGRRVAELINNEVRSAGNHTISFDASRLSSGVYIYQLRTASGNTITKKLTLIK